MKTVIIVPMFVVLFFLGGTRIFAQKDKLIYDFYEFANKEWLDSIVLHENAVVVNHVGILWNRIENKSIEILSGNSTYELDENHLYTLKQLRNFYKSTIELSDNDIERFSEVQKHFPMLFGVLFSKITVTSKKEERIKEIIKYLIISYRTKIKNSNKIEEYYKNLFLAKLDKMEFEIGAPALSCFPKAPILSDHSFVKNIQLSKEYLIEKNKNKSNWNTPPYETYCFYNFYDNKIKIYAGTIFDFSDEDDVVYLFATIGWAISHEMTHAFDNVGKDFDQNGKKNNVVKKIFSGALFSKIEWKDMYYTLINQFNQYSIQDSLVVDGKKTLQENIADLGGVEISLFALKLYLKEKHPSYSEEEETETLKRYFIFYTQFWKEKATSDFEKYTLSRLHTPQKFRAIGPIYNQDEFYELFEIGSDSKYYIPKNKRISVW